MKDGKDESQELGSHWHFYFLAMIVSTLIGMKVLSTWEERINEVDVPASPSKKSKKQPPLEEDDEEYGITSSP
jgi:hypothetical protein